MMRTARLSEEMSDSLPMTVGAGKSPRRWIARIDAAIAAALDAGGTSPTITALIGLVERNNKRAANPIPGQYTVGDAAVRATYTMGVARSIETALSQR